MTSIEIRDAVRQLVADGRLKQAIKSIKKWGSENANDWIVSEANSLLDDMKYISDSFDSDMSERILALADCIITGGFPETAGLETPESNGSASSSASGSKWHSSSADSSEINAITDNHADSSEGMPPKSASLPVSSSKPIKKSSARPSSGGTPTASGSTPTPTGAKMPTKSSKSKPVFSAEPPPPPSFEIADIDPSPIIMPDIQPSMAAAIALPAMSVPTPVPILMPISLQTGGLLYNIPSKMKQNEDTTCIVRIAFDKTQLKTADDDFTEEVVKEIRISRLMEVEMVNEGTEEVFKIVAKSQKQQSLDSFEATEWRFAVRPLVAGTQSLLLKVTIVETDAQGKETRKEKILEEEIVISTEKVRKTPPKAQSIASIVPNTEGPLQGFLSADLKLTDLKTLLFMGANPPGTRMLQLEIEHSRIATKINNRFRIEVEKFLSASEIPELIIDRKPAIIHFSGHGKDPNSTEQGQTDGTTRAIGRKKTDKSNQGGIVVFDDDMRSLKVVDDAALDFIFDNITTNFNILIEVVVFNSCFSESQAKVIGKHVPYVVGSTRAIADDVAIAFAAGFYFGVSKGLSIEKAFSSGKMQAVLADKKAKDLIVLYRMGEKTNL